MNTAHVDSTDPWTLVSDLVLGIPHPLLLGVDCFAALLVISALAALVVRIWRGDLVALGPLHLGRPQTVRDLQAALAAAGKAARLRTNVCWMVRERINEANQIISDGSAEPTIRVWCRRVLIDTLTALSEGGHDRHRASLWIKSGEQLRLFEGIGFRQSALDGATLPLMSIAGSVVESGRSYSTANVGADRAFSPKPQSGPPYRSLLAVPVTTPADGTIAALCVDAETQGYFDDDHAFFAGCFADLVALLVARLDGEERGDDMPIEA